MKNTLFAHYTSELKYRIGYTIVCTNLTFCVTYYYIQDLLDLIIEPFQCSFILYKPWELFLCYIYITFFISMMSLLINASLQVILFCRTTFTYSYVQSLQTYFLLWILSIIGTGILHQHYIYPVIFDFITTLGTSSEHILLKSSKQISLNISVLEFVKLYINTLTSALVVTTLSFLAQRKIAQSVENLNYSLQFRKLIYLGIGLFLTLICPPDVFIFSIYYSITLIIFEILILRAIYVKNKKFLLLSKNENLKINKA